jgi:hypothetical protein
VDGGAAAGVEGTGGVAAAAVAARASARRSTIVFRIIDLTEVFSVRRVKP